MVGEGQSLWEQIKADLKSCGLPHVMRTKAGCFRICQGGPWIVIYPEGVWYGEVTKSRWDQILREHLIGGRPVGALAALTHPLETKLSSAPVACSRETSETLGMIHPPLSTIVLGGGCFWCLEAVFERLEHVTKVRSGYAGGQMPNPDYHSVCAGKTGHAEVVEIQFDASKLSLDAVLELFWKAHDPTTLNRQGADIGTQYRSIILCADEEQLGIALQSKEKAAAEFQVPIVTEIGKLEHFFPAEEYHQGYYRANSHAPYCMAVIDPKLRKLGI